ncbi:hypothetical protein [Xanthomonas albilineans]|nr:hypothetical protein [Xanthomonas albilineans]
MNKYLILAVSIIFFLISLVFVAWSIQAAWLTFFAHDKAVVQELSVRFYIRGGIGFLFFIASIFMGFKALRVRRYNNSFK